VSNENEPGHGHSVAAWTSVVVMLIAVTGGTIAYWFAVEWLVWAFAGLLLVGAVLWGLLNKLGFGEKVHESIEKVHS